MRTLAIVLLSALTLAPPAGAAGRGSSFVGFFTWSPRAPQDLRQTLALYEKADPLAAAAAAERALGGSDSAFRDDFLLLRSLAFADLGWRDEAEKSFAALLELKDPSPYYPLALLGLVESQHQEGRTADVIAAYRRYWELPWKGSSRRDLRRRALLESYGDLRRGGPRLTEEERELVSSPSRLAEQLRGRKDYATERMLYLAGLDLFRGRQYARSLEALSRIGLLSVYFPYALYTAAQNLYALGDVDEARARIALLLRFPALDESERALGERAGLLLVQMLFEEGRTDAALEAARAVGRGGRYALAAALLRAEITLATDQPSLALAYYADLAGMRLGPRLDAERALGVGEAYAKLGDYASATASLRTAGAELESALARLRPPQAETETARLRALVEADVASLRRFDSTRRARIAAGIRRVVAFKAPMNVGKLVRVAFASHKNTIVGQPVYDLKLLAEGERPLAAERAAPEGPWLRYVESPRRAKIEGAQRLRLDLERPGPRAPLRVFDALLGVVEGRFGGADAAADAARLADRLGAVLGKGFAGVDRRGAASPAEIAALRRGLVAGLADGGAVSPVDPGLADETRRDTQRLLDDAVGFELRAIVDDEAEELRHIEFNLQTVLSDAIVRQNAAVRSQQSQPRDP